MQVRDDIDLGVATHTGPVRTSNEDDYLVFEPEQDAELASRGRLFVLADGMGGVAGGAEASRTAVRALAASYLADAEGDEAPGAAPIDVAARLLQGFNRAAAEVHRASRASPQLAEMGTTLTALVLRGTGGWIGHVGDTRCVRFAANRAAERLTDDHAVEEPRHLLTRCIGAGREREDVDQIEFDVAVGDAFVLMTDGVWDVMPDGAIESIVRSAATAGRAAGRLIDEAIAAGTTDNVTVVVVRVLSIGAEGRARRELDLPVGESLLPLEAEKGSLSAPRWPWLLMAVGLGLCALAAGKLFFGWGASFL